MTLAFQKIMPMKALSPQALVNTSISMITPVSKPRGSLQLEQDQSVLPTKTFHARRPLIWDLAVMIRISKAKGYVSRALLRILTHQRAKLLEHRARVMRGMPTSMKAKM